MQRRRGLERPELPQCRLGYKVRLERFSFLLLYVIRQTMTIAAARGFRMVSRCAKRVKHSGMVRDQVTGEWTNGSSTMSSRFCSGRLSSISSWTLQESKSRRTSKWYRHRSKKPPSKREHRDAPLSPVPHQNAANTFVHMTTMVASFPLVFPLPKSVAVESQVTRS